MTKVKDSLAAEYDQQVKDMMLCEANEPFNYEFSDEWIEEFEKNTKQEIFRD